jgi:hypothetical protein
MNDAERQKQPVSHFLLLMSLQELKSKIAATTRDLQQTRATLAQTRAALAQTNLHLQWFIKNPDLRCKLPALGDAPADAEGTLVTDPLACLDKRPEQYFSQFSGKSGRRGWIRSLKPI